MCAPVTSTGKCAMSKSQVCDACMHVPSGCSTRRPLRQLFLFLCGAFAHKKWNDAPESAIAFLLLQIFFELTLFVNILFAATSPHAP